MEAPSLADIRQLLPPASAVAVRDAKPSRHGVPTPSRA